MPLLTDVVDTIGDTRDRNKQEQARIKQQQQVVGRQALKDRREQGQIFFSLGDVLKEVSVTGEVQTICALQTPTLEDLEQRRLKMLADLNAVYGQPK